MIGTSAGMASWATEVGANPAYSWLAEQHKIEDRRPRGAMIGGVGGMIGVAMFCAPGVPQIRQPANRFKLKFI